MTFEQFDNFQDELFKECVTLMRNSKGKEYANSTSRFGNFDRLATELDLTSPQVAWVYAKKHLDSLAQAIRTKEYTGRAEPLSVEDL
jgi:hypothetical protein